MREDVSIPDCRAQLRRLHVYLLLAALVWTLALGAMAWKLNAQYGQMTMELARKEAEANFNKDQAFRFWATLHGGVYVPVTEDTPPNPYLTHVPERDIVTPSGRELTLMNPAYMVRQLNEQFGELFGVRGNITSLDPLRPENRPDPWERQALARFDKGGGEVMEVSEIDGKPYLRFMAPMPTEQGCLLCHAHQGYKVGEVRGGVSVAVPLSEYFEQERSLGRTAWSAFLTAWLLGLLALLLARRRLVADMHRQQAANIRISRLNEGLEERVRERTAELEAERSRAEAANQAKSVFLANMSHELRTPLNAILGFAQLAMHEPGASDRQRENLVYVRRNGEHLLSLINDVLDMAKIEAGRQSVELDTVDLSQTLDDAVDMLRPRAADKGLALSMDLDPALPGYIRADGRKLRQVLVNLLSNAVKYTERGEVVLRAGVDRPAEDKPPRLLLEVVDTGRGLDEDELERVFEPFYQSGRNGATEGTGLGLPITRQFVELMGGEIGAESRPGAGSRFFVLLPLDEVRGAASAKEDSRRVIGLDGDKEWRVLVVDDADANRVLLHRMLEEVGFAVREARNGREAVEVFEQWRPHFVWMDMRMPEMDGYEATRRIRNAPDSRQTVIAALTASTSLDDQEKVFASGCVALLRKPFRAADIFETMRRHLGLRYIHADSEPGDAATPAGGDKPDDHDGELSARLAALPDTLQQPLGEALREGDLDALDALLARIARLDRTLADRLHAHVERFEYDAVLAMLEGGPS